MLGNQYQYDKQYDIRGVIPRVFLEEGFIGNFAPMERPANKSAWVRKQGHNDDFSYKFFHVFASPDCRLSKVHKNGPKVNERFRVSCFTHATFARMKAEIKAYERTDNEDLSSYEPEDKQVFGFTLLFSIGVKGQEGADYFEVDVASPGYLEHLVPQPFFLRHTILATDYNIPKTVALMTQYVEELEEESWEKLASKISRVARWEFEDYRA